MSMKSIAKALYLLYRAGVPALLEGVHGIGKTSILYQLHARIRAEKRQSADHAQRSTLDARDLAQFSVVGPEEFGLWAFSAANVSIEEIIGYPQAGTIEDTDRAVLRYLRSNNFIPPADHRGGGILAPDELNLSDPPVERALMSLALEGRFLDYTLPKDVFIVTSQNPATGEYHSRRLNPPTINRFCTIKVVVEASEVIQYFQDRNFHPAILDCVSENSDKVLNPHQAKCEFTMSQEPTSRSWENVNRVMTVATPEEIATVGLVVFSGLLGQTAGAVFQKFAMEQGERSITIDEVLESYGYNAATYDEDKTSIKGWPMTPMRKRVKKICNRASVRADLINVALSSLAQRLKTITNDVSQRMKLPENKGKNVEDLWTPEQKCAVINALAFLCDLPPDQSGPPFMRQLKEQGFEYTFKAVAKHTICEDYYQHWNNINQSAMSNEVTSDDT